MNNVFHKHFWYSIFKLQHKIFRELLHNIVLEKVLVIFFKDTGEIIVFRSNMVRIPIKFST